MSIQFGRIKIYFPIHTANLMTALCHQPIPDSAALQIINSTTIYEEYLRAQQKAQHLKGGMYWKKQGPYEYLVRTSVDNLQRRLGPRTSETEAIYNSFVALKQEENSRLLSLREALDDAQRLNRAVRAGHVPNILISILRRLQDEGMMEHFVVIGPQAIYAYEAAAGVRITSASSDRSPEWLRNIGTQVSLLTDLPKKDEPLIARIFQRLDPTFTWKKASRLTARNARGFEVNLYRSRAMLGGQYSAMRTWRTPRFVTPIISINGIMAMMQTISPSGFVKLKREELDAPVCPNNAAQDQCLVDAVQRLLDTGTLLEQRF
ncbi:GSU2403 family nucleotidyltransferase fold protein [Comamonas antarctica]|uniref:Nucleotidyltransferase-like domain-containing protein n=1 Tax=Comamonas antarctica TaxID=2743470 RepID=A0A6N1X9Q3_9BURK|nr:GSU2403 family nucleotidyltransferase fold protein [Comamonas antarctica]QKV54722.1 hypothetical protein HUK68_18485 [Comamonas antarctica]